MTELKINARWEYVTDAVMGGRSVGDMTQQSVQGRMAAVLRGQVSLENNGGFVQIATDVVPPAGDWEGLALDVAGNGESYDIRLRTAALQRPWQSFRTEIVAGPDWTTIHVPFSDFVAHKHDMQFNAKALTRIGILAIGRVFNAEIAVAHLRFYRR